MKYKYEMNIGDKNKEWGFYNEDINGRHTLWTMCNGGDCRNGQVYGDMQTLWWQHCIHTSSQQSYLSIKK